MYLPYSLATGSGKEIRPTHGEKNGFLGNDPYKLPGRPRQTDAVRVATAQERSPK